MSSWIIWSVSVVAVLVASGLLIQALQERLDAIRYPAPGRLIQIRGRKLHLLCQGDAPGPTIVIEQGAGSPSILWWPLQEQICQFARICLYDRAGYLWSDPASAVQTLDERVEDLHALLHTGQVPGPYVLVGHSFGVAVIRLFAERYPAEVAGLVAIDGIPERVAFGASYDAYVDKITRMLGLVGIAARLGLVRLVLTFLRAPPPSLSSHSWRTLKAFMAQARLFRTMAGDMRAVARVPAAERTDDRFGVCPEDCPLLVLTHEQRFPGPAAVLEEGWMEGQESLARQSTQSSLQIATGCNHMIPFEAPMLVVSALRNMLTQIASRARPI